MTIMQEQVLLKVLFSFSDLIPYCGEHIIKRVDEVIVMFIELAWSWKIDS
jgi:hypothetical protein